MDKTLRNCLKLLILCLIAIPVSAQGIMFGLTAKKSAPTAIALISHIGAASSSGGNITTGAINTTGANFLVASCSVYAAGGTCVVSDSLSNTWACLALQTGTTVIGKICYAENATGGAAQTFTAGGGGGSYPAVAVAAFSNVITSGSFDQQNGANGSGLTLATGSVTPGSNNELIVAGFGLQTNGGIPTSINSGFTITDEEDHGANNFGAVLAYKIQTSAAAVNPTWTASSSQVASVAMIATFK